MKLVTVTVRASSFLYRQVRNTVGVLAAAGQGLYGAPDIARLLDARDRALLPRGAPPEGLFLTRVVYRPEFLSLDAFPTRVAPPSSIQDDEGDELADE